MTGTSISLTTARAAVDEAQREVDRRRAELRRVMREAHAEGVPIAAIGRRQK
jgi:hypothetical protein